MKPLWTPEQDSILLQLGQTLQKPINWKKALQFLKLSPQFQSRTSKECRERWSQLLDSNSDGLDWTEKQEDLLLSKHEQIGNRWLQLSKYFPQRSQNFLKNQFYSIFRRSLRRANKLIYLFKGNSIRPITTTIVLKVLATCEYKYDPNDQYPESLVSAACELKSVLAEFCRSSDDRQLNEERVARFLQAINLFRKEFREKNSKDKKAKVPAVKKQRESIFSQIKKEEVPLKMESKVEVNQSHISSTLLYPEPPVEKQLIRSMQFIQSPIQSIQPIQPIQSIQHIQPMQSIQTMQPIITQIFFPKITFVEFGGVVEEEVPQFPVQTSFFEPYSNRMFTMINEVPLSLENSMLFYNNIRRQQSMDGSMMFNSNYSMDQSRLGR